MALGEDLQKAVKEIFDTNWSVRDGREVPEPERIALGNDAVRMQGTVLYADLADSTDLVDGYYDWFAAEVYKAYLHCASKIIRAEGGVITAFDGDRVMAVFIGDTPNTSAARCALKINYAVAEIITPSIARKFPKSPYPVRHAVGIDTSTLFIARTGIRGSDDLVWVGRAANYAAKLCAIRQDNYTSWITKAVYDKLNNEAKVGANGGQMWEARRWTARNDMPIYRSNWWWKV